MKQLLAFSIAAILAAGLVQSASAQFQQGGVDHPGEWHVGEGIKTGDYFSYSLCYIDYKECAEFEMDFWVEGEVRIGTEKNWLVQVIAYDGNKIVKGHMNLLQIGLEPSGGSPEISSYRSAFKSSIAWLSAFANADKPKKFSDPSWGKIANIGGEQILPKEILQNGLTVEAGHFEDVILIGWRTGGANSEVYVADDFPFPIKASTWTHVSSGIPPPEYRFELLDYQENLPVSPFADVVPSADEFLGLDCPSHESLATSIKKPTEKFAYNVHVFYGPEFPVENCPIKFQVKFINKYDDTGFLDRIHYDIWAVNDQVQRTRSIAEDEGRPFLFSPSGQSLLEFVIREPPGIANYVVWIYGQSPEHIVPSDAPDYLQIEIPISAGKGGIIPDVPPVVPEPPPVILTPPVTPDQPAPIPAWIKSSAGFWVEGSTSDAEFVSAIEHLINVGIITVQDTPSGAPNGEPLPSWIRDVVGFWVDGATADAEFLSAIEYLIKEGIIAVS